MKQPGSRTGLLSPLPHVNLKTTKPPYVKSCSEERAETWFTSPHRARAAVNIGELQPLQVCQHILDTRERLHSSPLYPDPAAAALSARCWCSRAALLSQLLLLTWTLQPSPFRGCPWCWPPARGIARFATGFAILVLNLFLETASSKLGGHIWQISKNCCWMWKVCSNMMLCQE